MTVAELYALPSYANYTYGRPIHPLQCVICAASPGHLAPISPAGRCVRCEAKARPTRDVILLFKPLHKVASCPR
jgi:hypothetical protein